MAKAVLPKDLTSRFTPFTQQKSGATQTFAPQEVMSVPLERLISHPDNSRKYFDPVALQSLAESLESKGQLQNLLVRPKGDLYEVVVGERRFRAAQIAGLARLRVECRNVSDSEVRWLNLTENLQREDLNPYEETIYILRLMALVIGEPLNEEDLQGVALEVGRAYRAREKGVLEEVHQQIIGFFDTLGISFDTFRSHRLRLLNLPEDIQEVLRRGLMPYPTATLLGKLPDGERQEMTQRVLDEALSLEELKRLLRPEKAALAPWSQRLRQMSKRIDQVKLSKAKTTRLEALLKQIQELLDD